MDMAKVTSDDYPIDLGSGDGRTVIAAANGERGRLGSNMSSFANRS